MLQLASGGDGGESYQEHTARLRGIFSDYDKVSEYAPRSPFPYYNKGILYAEAGDLEAALKEFSSRKISARHIITAVSCSSRPATVAEAPPTSRGPDSWA